MSKLYVLGDSWSWGWDTPSRKTGNYRQFETNMCTVLAQKLGLELVNISCPGNSFPQITQEFFRRIACNLKPDDVVFMCIPPDIRWHRAIPPGSNADKPKPWASSTDNEDTCSVLFGTNGAQFNPKLVRPNHILQSDDMNSLELEILQNHSNMYWFKYHTSLFLTALSNWTKVHNINFFAQHNYGSFENLCEFADTSILLDPEHSMWEWLGLPKHHLLADSNQDGPNAIVIGEDFPNVYQQMQQVLLCPDGEQIDWHPNQQSHIDIGNKLYELCNQRLG